MASAVVAYPATYGNSGVMTFAVNHDGVVYQKDLGKNTAKLAGSMQAYNPDDVPLKNWTILELDVFDKMDRYERGQQ